MSRATSSESRAQFRALLGLVGAILLVALVVRIGPRAIGAQLLQIGPRALWIFAPYALGTAIGAYPWAWLMPNSARPDLRGVIASRFAASGANALLPFFGLAGEPARLLWLQASDRSRGLAAIIVDRVLYNTASAFLLLVGALVALLTTPLPTSIGISAAVIAIAIGAVTLGIARAMSQWGIGNRLHALLRKHLDRVFARGEFGAEADESLRGLLRVRRPLWLGLLVHVAGRAALCAEVYVALWVLGAAPSINQALVLATVPIATGLVASSIPSQLGVQEAAQSLVCGALGIDPAIGFTLVLLQRGRQLVFLPLTPALLGIARPKAPATAELAPVE